MHAAGASRRLADQTDPRSNPSHSSGKAQLAMPDKKVLPYRSRPLPILRTMLSSWLNGIDPVQFVFRGERAGSVHGYLRGETTRVHS